MTVEEQPNPSKPSRIVIVTYNIHNLGGVPRSTSNIANGLVERGYLVDIASISPGVVPMSHELDPRISVFTCNSKISSAQKVTGSPRGRIIRDLAVKVFYKWKPAKFRFVKPQREGIEKLRDFLTSLDGSDFVMLVTDVNSMDYVNAVYSEGDLERPPLIAQYKGTVEALTPVRLRRIVESYSSASLVLTLTPDDAKILQQSTSNEVDWITNPIPTVDRPLRQDRKKQVVTIGRLAPEKGLINALHAWKKANHELEGYELLIYGEGPMRSQLEREIDRMGLSSSVRLAGITHEPLSVLEEAELMLLPSKHEGFGMVIAEAASVGTPTLAFDCSPGVRIQIESGINGVLVPNGNVDVLAGKLVEILKSGESLVMGEKARETVKRFGYEPTFSRWDNLINKAIHNRQI